MRSRKQHLQPATNEISLPEKTSLIEPLHNFDWKTAPRRQLRPFKPTYHITMGTTILKVAVKSTNKLQLSRPAHLQS